MNPIRAVIVDDEPLARRGIRAQLREQKDIEIVSECRNGREAIAAIQQQEPDLVFLDVQMPELDGFEVLNAVGVERMPAVIFVTAYDSYALRAFEVHALDYLLKPFDDERFAHAIKRARDHLAGRNLQELSGRLQGLLEDLKARSAPKYAERLVVKSAGRIVFLSVAEIDFIRAADNYVRIHAGHDQHLLRETMNSLEQKLDPHQFLRVHRSTIVNVQRIREAAQLFRGEYELVLRDGRRIATGRNYRDRLRSLFGKPM
jgi:two-component system, LytTR family, response regulator